MSEVTTINSVSRLDVNDVKVGRQASPDSARQAAKEGGKHLPPSASQGAAKHTLEVSEVTEVSQAEKIAEKVSAAVAEMNEYVQANQRDLRFSVDEESGETVVKVLDRKTEEVIRQIPDEIFLKLAQNLSVDEPVNFFNEQA